MEEKFDVEIKGTAPLLFNRFTESEDNKSKRAGKVVNKEKEAEESLYKDNEGNIVTPATHLEASMIKAATQFKIPGQGKKTFKDAFKGGVFVSPEMIPHQGNGYEVFVSPVVINRARVMKARAKLDDWTLNFQIQVIDERITPHVLKDILTEAGKYHGIGDWRPRFGRFEVKKFEPIKKTSRNKS
jgi:hypothetical protein